MDPTICTLITKHPAWALKKNDRLIVNNEECTFLNLGYPKTPIIKTMHIVALQHDERIQFIVNVTDPFKVSDETLTFINPVNLLDNSPETTKRITRQLKKDHTTTKWSRDN
jgi:hypothetical protein